ncbi:1-aminocyclopropane-1-carboxylate deaminase/D-cysteine desulfhydrase [Flavobacterium gawalongense]|uniref:1-aminocyclopropane-1-carboxylate deaminase/D-cysteine desulfhydrase n=1 Tax=Flavobacterium gawalongense TaxID=2594432 RepID=A0A553BKA7_9FLAO|nr:pyridoxal-phosphate dependent enzyme [Flavobacterium gawalongense]TRX03976.1 1-aminocyclopropane-1-carboxylate deaminase/D-cysteine desulfhydrase [Flavobacterium gawalongense]TRX07153.1 1-aminocyclopropane-1-carboxylate deaminase/D-cysteine desulfhydrase [Flavobacterium gawalongense]TRX08685.1 1-aminocyclopropane-1-carboxylate deaminase/D-cysteine desulfhydrase [Flavobacterium gawalongense]TRX09478.1 1-aminocyclopropane-1-carboxylate deaminase/D-cysteine desulfhydrase [Flavobacterium gawalon
MQSVKVAFLLYINFTFVPKSIPLNQQLKTPFPNSISVYIKREDLIHPFVSGNKFRKLKYNLLRAKEKNQETLLTFGGAFSNHIAAVAFAGKEKGFKTIGIIRGDELGSKISENPTLLFAQNCGMQLEFISREEYRLKSEITFLENLKQKFGSFYLIPEGGTNALAIKGCQEILTQEDAEFDYICCSIGTGGTISGIINSVLPYQKVLGFPALKGDFLKEEIRNFVQNENWELITDYHFGGYGKVNSALIGFINQFYAVNQIPLDPIYTGKMVFGVIDLIQKNYFPAESKILLIHTGGIQGIQGMNIKLRNKQLPIIDINV